MNHRMLFFLSVIVTTVGIMGIIWQDKPTVPTAQPMPVINSTKHIITAQATRDLIPYDILKKEDYVLRTIKTESDSDPRDVSLLDKGNLSGYLVSGNVQKGDFLLPALVESPHSPTFPARSLKRNEAPYTYRVKAGEEYLFSSLSVGDDVSLFIRLTEIDKKNVTPLVQEGGYGSATQNPLKNYIIQKLMGPITVISTLNKSKDINKSYSVGESAGMILLRVTGNQLAELKAVEKTGEILLFPFNDDEGIERTRMDEVLPQFGSASADYEEEWTTIKQLRGKE